MTTGYDCPDILNLGLFRPIFSPTDFIQIKGRGTRRHNFLDQLFDGELEEGVTRPQKNAFKLFDFFATCEYFEEEFKYDEVLELLVAVRVVKLALAEGVNSRVTDVPVVNGAEQPVALPDWQAMPAGVLLTVPEPERMTVRG